MPTKVIATTFPAHWSYGQYEIDIHASLADQISAKWPYDNNLLFGTTWMGPQTETAIDRLIAEQQKFDRLIMTSTVDAALSHQVYPMRDQLVKAFDIKEVYLVGNFDGDYEFNIFAIACLDHFRVYDDRDLPLKSPRWRYCAYNRKPYRHRLQLVRTLVESGMDKHGVITLGQPFPGEPDHGLYRTIGERNEDYVQWGHWYDLGTLTSTPHEIPHDLYSLHNWDVWQHHFLHIIGTTADSSHANIFLNQISFKPLIGMRPFVINGQTRQYEFLRRNGFRTFNHYWPMFDENIDAARDDDPQCLARQLTDVIRWLVSLSDEEIMAMYQDMLPDLQHNRSRWYEWALEQKTKSRNLFS